MTRPAHILAAAALALGLSTDAEAEDVVETDTTSSIREHLHGRQQEAFDCAARVVNILGGRQGGKSYWLAGWLWDGAIKRPGSLNCYIALSKESARYIIWPEVVVWCQNLGVDMSCLSHATLTVKLPNGSVIRCSGTDDRRTIESWRGMKIYRLAIDEMGSQPEDLIKYFIGLLWPTMAKFNGQMARAGTPAVVCDGYWYDQTNDERDTDRTPPLFKWTIFDNPGITEHHDVDAFLDEMCEDLDIERDSVTYRREILAEWVEDKDDLVFPLGPRNHVDALPTHTDTGVELDPSRWRFVLSEDCGYVDQTAFSLVAAHRDRTDEYVVATEQHENMLSEPAGDRIREVLANEPGWVPKELEPALRRARLVIDTGGNRSHAEEIAKRTGLHYTPAKKTDKESAMRRTRDRIKAGRTKVVRGKQNDGIRSEWARIMWDKEQRAKGILLPKKGKDHRSDATCYGLRELRHYVKEEPEKDTRTEAERTADELMEKRQKRYKRKRRGVVVR